MPQGRTIRHVDRGDGIGPAFAGRGMGFHHGGRGASNQSGSCCVRCQARGSLASPRYRISTGRISATSGSIASTKPSVNIAAFNEVNGWRPAASVSSNRVSSKSGLRSTASLAEPRPHAARQFADRTQVGPHATIRHHDAMSWAGQGMRGDLSWVDLRVITRNVPRISVGERPQCR